MSTVGPFIEAGVPRIRRPQCTEEPEWRCLMKQLLHLSGAQKGRCPEHRMVTEVMRADTDTKESELSKEEKPEACLFF